MKIDWSWPKVTALTVAQAGAHTALGLLIGKSIIGLDWLQVAQASGSAALVALLGAVVAYTLPAGKATAAVSASVGAAQDAAALSSFKVLDAHEARGSTLA